MEGQYTSFSTAFNFGKYLAPPPTTSVVSEHLFSIAGDIYDEKRKILAPERAEALLLVKKNFSVVGGNYQY